MVVVGSLKTMTKNNALYIYIRPCYEDIVYNKLRLEHGILLVKIGNRKKNHNIYNFVGTISMKSRRLNMVDIT